MTLPFPIRQLRFYLTGAAPCPYLPDRQERKLFAHLPLHDADAANDALTQGGFRRSQNIAYRPHCQGCAECRSVRIPVDAFQPSRSERRTLARNRDLTAHVVEAEATVEQFELLRAYLNSRHADGGMAEMTWGDYVAMVEDTAVRSHIVEYRRVSEDGGPGALMACALVDQLNDGLSLVYSFFDPEIARRSPGVFVILNHIARARALNLGYVYLGYWVRGSEKMDYKARFRPIEVLIKSGWTPLADALP